MKCGDMEITFQAKRREEIFMMKKGDIRIRGEVQMAGFWTFIKNTADSLNLKEFAENVEDGSVRLVCEGEEEVNAGYEEYKGEFSGFERRGADVPGEKSAGESKKVALMRSFDKKGEVMIDILSSMNETLRSVKEDTSLMLEKQDETIGAIGEVSEKIDGGKEEIVMEISSLRGDLRPYMENKFAIIEHEIEGIKAKIRIA